MNKLEREKAISQIVDWITDIENSGLQDELQNACEAADEKYDALSKKAQESDKGQKLDALRDALKIASDALDEALAALQTAENALTEVE